MYIEVENLAGLHDGEACAIIGNGPSLNEICLDHLTEITTVAVNQIYHLYNDTEWRPTYYAMLHEQNNEQWKIDGIQHNISDSIVFIDDKFNVNETYPNLIRLRKLGDLKRVLHPDVKMSHDSTNISTIANNLFSDDLCKGYYTLHSEFVMAQIIAYMGFREVFLIGFDPELYENQFVDFDNVVDMRSYGNNKLDYFYKALESGGPRELLNGIIWSLFRRFPRIYNALVDKPMYFDNKYKGEPKSSMEKYEHLLSHSVIKEALNMRSIKIYQVHSDGLPCYEKISPQKFKTILKSM